MILEHGAGVFDDAPVATLKPTLSLTNDPPLWMVAVDRRTESRTTDAGRRRSC